MRRLYLSIFLLFGTGGARAQKPARSRTGLRAAVQQAFKIDLIKDEGDKSDEHSYRYQAFDEKNGYARVVGPFEGHSDFFLLRGPKADVLVQADYTCTVTCEQRLTAFRLRDGKAPVAVPFLQLLDLKGFEPLRKSLLSLCRDGQGDLNTDKHLRAAADQDLPGCPLVFSFSKNGADARIYKVLDRTGSGYSLSSGKSELSARAVLHWDGAKLIALEPEESAPIFLDRRAMDRLF